MLFIPNVGQNAFHLDESTSRITFIVASRMSRLQLKYIKTVDKLRQLVLLDMMTTFSDFSQSLEKFELEFRE